MSVCVHVFPGGWHRPELDPHSEGVWWLCCAIRERKGFYKTKNSNLSHMWGAFWEHRDISWWLEGHFGLQQKSTQKWADSHFRNHASGPNVTLKAGYLCTLQKDANKQHNLVTFCIHFLFLFNFEPLFSSSRWQSDLSPVDITHVWCPY